MRYQFMPRAHVAGIDIGRAKEAATCGGATHVREAYPIMEWGRGTNQPRTIAFTAPDNSLARQIWGAYGEEDAFVWNITEKQYV